jgi:primosomal replication protein N
MFGSVINCVSFGTLIICIRTGGKVHLRGFIARFYQRSVLDLSIHGNNIVEYLKPVVLDKVA